MPGRILNWLLGVCILFLVLGSVIQYYVKYQAIRSDISSHSEFNSQLHAKKIEGNISELIQITLSLKGVIESTTPHPSSNSYDQSLNALFSSLIKNDSKFDQIRIISSAGMELYRFQRSKLTGGVQSIPPTALQDKSHRDYFKALQKSPDNGIYLSDLNLNIENGKIQTPHNPTFRVGVTLELEGFGTTYLIINYTAYNFFATEYKSEEYLANIYLADEEGYLKNHIDPEKSWARDLGGSNNLGEVLGIDSHTLNQMRSHRSITFSTPQNTYTAQKFYPLAIDACRSQCFSNVGRPNFSWTIISAITNNQIEPVLSDLNRTTTVFLLISLAMTSSIFFYLHKQEKSIQIKEEELITAKDDLIYLSESADQISSCLAVLDGDGDIKYANRWFSEASKCQKNNIHKSNMSPERKAAISNCLYRSKLSKKAETTEYQLESDDNISYLRATVTPVIQEDNSWLYFLMEEDYTERETLQIEARRLNAEVVHSSKLASIGELAAGVGHEINNPLAVIRGQTELLNFKLSPHVQESQHLTFALKCTESITHAIERISTIVNGLRSFARVDDGELSNIYANQVTEEIYTFLSPLYRKDEVKMVLFLEAREDCILFRPGELQQVITNITNNARDALEGKPNAKIKIRTFNDSKNYSIRISDNGTGIKSKVLEKIFDTFYTTKPAGKGTGLGMGIVKNIIEKANGSIEIDSIEGRGTTVTISIPLVSSQCVTPERDTDKEHATPILNGESVLVVDDDDGVRSVIVEFCKAINLIVEEARDGIEAIERLKTSKFDFMITDIRMPRMNGLDLIKSVRENGLHPGPIIAVTGGLTSEQEIDAHLFDTYAVPILRKPITLDTLAVTLQNNKKPV